MIGIAAKAGKVRSGEFSSERSVREKKACVCLLSSDASERTKKHFTDMCAFRRIPIYVLDTDKASLGHMIGRGPRSSAVIEDEGLAGVIVGLIDGGNSSGK
jgi:ribosomal protein L7Ae-like RNA K-turn-binding protein